MLKSKQSPAHLQAGWVWGRGTGGASLCCRRTGSGSASGSSYSGSSSRSRSLSAPPWPQPPNPGCPARHARGAHCTASKVGKSAAIGRLDKKTLSCQSLESQSGHCLSFLGSPDLPQRGLKTQPLNKTGPFLSPLVLPAFSESDRTQWPAVGHVFLTVGAVAAAPVSWSPSPCFPEHVLGQGGLCSGVFLRPHNPGPCSVVTSLTHTSFIIRPCPANRAAAHSCTGRRLCDRAFLHHGAPLNRPQYP